MLDGLSAIAGQLRKPVFDARYAADQAIVRATLLKSPGSRKLVVVFMPYHSPEWFEKRLLKHLEPLKANLLFYDFNASVIQADLLTVKNSFEYIALSIAADLQALQKLHRYSTVTLVGDSLGCVALCVTAEKLRHFDDVLLLVPGDNLADSLWNGWRTRRLRNHYKRLSYNLADLEKEWDMLAPASHVDVFKGHPVHVILASKDKFIPTIYGRKLVSALKTAHAQVHFVEKPYGHLATLLTSTTDD